MSHRQLSTSEIKQIEKQGCVADDWKKVKFKEPVEVSHFQNVRFSGKNKLGIFDADVELAAGMIHPAGVYFSWLHNATVEDNSLILNVGRLMNYSVGHDAILQNINSISVEGKSTFGNGTEIEILNEAGGRSLKIFDKLNAQIAYLMVLYRDKSKMISQLDNLVDKYVGSIEKNTGTVGNSVQIQNTSIVKNVNVGAHASIQNATRLENGSIISNENASVFIGDKVIAEHFIVQSGSKIDGGAMLSNCFVGQAVKMGRQYSAENSAFFANSELFHGEAVALFAGPYTVTHHKSTLMIAGLFSFFNAGSGTNQSNHLYKLGPVHQGIVERGAKTGSFSYLLWPSRVGAFTAVIGKHYANFDASDLPFSYISEEDGKSALTPAMNLFTVGTRRDSNKWPARDKRRDSNKRDLIIFDLFNPYTIGKVLKGIKILRELGESATKKQEFVNYHGLQIKRLLLKTTAKYYEMAVKIFIGESVIDQLQSLKKSVTFAEIQRSLKPQVNSDSEWIDMAGLIVSKHSVNELLTSLEEGKFNTVSKLNSALKDLYCGYEKQSWGWCAHLIEQRLDTKIEEITAEQLLDIVNDWRDNNIKLNNMIMKDALKEYDSNAQTGFGIDGDDEVKKLDFEAVRGTSEENNFIQDLKADTEHVENVTTEITRMIERCL